VIPESKGLLLRSNEEFRVVRLMQTPMGLCYEGVPASLSSNVATTIMPNLIDVAEIPGESQMGLYDPATGVLEALPEAGYNLGYVEAEGEEGATSGLFDRQLAAERLAAHRDTAKLARLAVRLGLEINPGGLSRIDMARKIVENVELRALLQALTAKEAAEEPPAG